MERTLVILKPDAVQRGIIGEVISRFERVGLRLVAMKMIHPDQDQYHHHYETIGQVITRRGQDVFDMNLDYMMMGPVVAMVWSGIEAVELVRKMVGATEPKSALPGTIRGDYAHMSYNHADSVKTGIPNIIHASGDLADAKQEIAHWFSESEMYDYEVLHEKFTQKKGKKGK